MNLNPALPAFGLPAQASLDTLTSRFGMRVAAGLTERSNQVDPDVSERLRFAREKALERARVARAAQAPLAVGSTRGGAAILAAPGGRWWFKLAAVLPAIALAAGLVLIQRTQDANQLSVAAEVDAALLADDLPPQAYRDAGFAEYLKTPSE